MGVSEIIISLVVIIILPLYFFYTSQYYKIKKFLRHFPKPQTVPLLGCALDFKSPGEFLKKLHDYRKQCGPLFHLDMGVAGGGLIAADHKFLEFLLSHNKLLAKTDNLKFLEPWIGTGLITADGGPKWKIHRKLLTPAFHFKILEQFVGIFEKDGNTLVEKLSEENGNKSLDIYPYITRCTLDVICETAMGTKIDVQNNSAYFQSVKDMCRIFGERTTSIFNRFDFFFSLTKDYQVQKKAVNILHSHTEEVIRNKRRELKEKQNEENDAEVDDLGRKRKKIFLDLILEATVDNQSLTDEEIREEVDTFMFAGHDTTATATTFILYCIAQSRHVQDKIIEEQKQILGTIKNPEVTFTNLQEMKYLENVIKEGLRLYSPVPFFGRKIDQDVEYNGMIIPNGVNVLIFVHGLHMSPEFYPNPEKFDPDRFEEMHNRHPFSFIPFSAGPRNCIGQKYAILEIKSLVSKVVRNFELSPAEPHHELKLSPETVLMSLNGVKVGLKLRQ